MDAKIKQYIEKQKSPQQEICFTLREIITNTFPGIEEEMKWGVPTFFRGKFYIVSLKNHVNLGFSIDGLSREEIALFEGNGKMTRHIQIKTIKDIDEKRIVKLLKIAGDRSSG